MTAEVTRLIEEFQLGEAGRQINDFFWSDFCDWYLEIAKVQIREGNEAAKMATSGILRSVLDQSLRLLHPFMPFVTEEVWQHLQRTSFPGEKDWSAPALIVASWPQVHHAALNEQAAADFALLQEIIVRIRDARNQAKIEPAKRVQVILAAGEQLSVLSELTALIEFLARTETPQLHGTLAVKPEKAMSLLAGSVEIYLPLAGLLDLDKELARLEKESASTEQEIGRIQAKLANESFVSRAKPEVVQKERDRLVEQEEKLRKLLERRKELA